MFCPKCKDCHLEPRSAEFDGVGPSAVLACPGCDGIWLHDSNLNKMCVLHDEEKATDFPEAPPAAKAQSDSKTGLCPECRRLMIRAKLEMDPPFYIEKCGPCDGYWFDKGELDRILNVDVCGNLSVVWTRAWQRRQRRKRGREHYLEQNRMLLGEEVFNAVIDLAKVLRDHPEQFRAVSLLQSELSETEDS